MNGREISTLNNFVDFEKEFDNVHGRNLWKVLRHYGIPAKVTKIISQF